MVCHAARLRRTPLSTPRAPRERASARRESDRLERQQCGNVPGQQLNLFGARPRGARMFGTQGKYGMIITWRVGGWAWPSECVGGADQSPNRTHRGSRPRRDLSSKYRHGTPRSRLRSSRYVKDTYPKFRGSVLDHAGGWARGVDAPRFIVEPSRFHVQNDVVSPPSVRVGKLVPAGSICFVPWW